MASVDSRMALTSADWHNAPVSEAALLLGNGAIARGLLEAGVEVVTAYPGTPSTEILEEVRRQQAQLGVELLTQWSVNEKVAFDIALAAAMCGKRAATAMKQVGLNVASDSLLSAAYTGVVGGFVVIVCDDPGPLSSQTEQDTRLFSLFAKVPVFDPSSPREARAMVKAALDLSERHGIPVILRPTTRVCHARQPIVFEPLADAKRRARLKKDPARWAATPRHRYVLHGLLNEKLDAIRQEFETCDWNREEMGDGSLGLIASGHAWAVARDLVREGGLGASLLKIGTPHPLPMERVRAFAAKHERVLILEEPDVCIEIQCRDRTGIDGRMTGHVPGKGELMPEVVADLLGVGRPPVPAAPGPPPRLCLGCGHRAGFLAIHQAFRHAIYAGDIGCYTLGINQLTLDTCLDMGASITLAEGFYHAHRGQTHAPPVVAVIGDSTFFHSGMTGLLNCVVNDARIVLVVMDNSTVAMTGAQPTPAAAGADIGNIVRGLGVRFVETIDPYEVDAMVALLKEAGRFTQREDGGVAVVVARRPCALMQAPGTRIPVEVIDDACNACDQCMRYLACPALIKDSATGRVHVDIHACNQCGQCLSACPQDAIVPMRAEQVE
jgi:indolepyruvate ferredoxin oxidoreductase alpha subunit